MIYNLIKIFLIFFSLNSFAQMDLKDYEILKYTKSFPSRYFEDLESTSQKLASKQDLIDVSDAAEIYNNSLKSIQKLFERGYILYEGEIYNYVNNVFKDLYKDEPNVLNEVNVYVTKLISANAFTTPDGTILINCGLISILDNKDELAFIIAHEVAHYLKNHTLKSKKESDQLEEMSFDTEDEKILYLKLSYNREFESESDAYGINKMISSEIYDPQMAVSALEKLEYRNTDLDTVSQEFYDLIISTEYIPDSADIFVKHQFDDIQKEEIENRNSVFRGDVDNYSTHPAVSKRKVAIKEMLKFSDYKFERNDSSYKFNKAEFKKIKAMSSFEAAYSTFESGNNLLAFAYASYLNETLPDNPLVFNLINKSLYWISYYKEINGLDNEPDDLPIFLRSRYWLIAKYFKEIKSSDLKKLAFFTVKRFEKRMKNDDTYSFYLALHAENFLGKETASIFFSTYKKKFPDGKYINYVNNKISGS